MDFCHHCLFAMNTPEAYEALFQGILVGDQTIFTRWDGVEASWRFIDKLLLLAPKKKIATYPSGSTGPKESDKLFKKKGSSWINSSFASPMINEVNFAVGDRRFNKK
jgi:glucose-6-phosphate 1-dehydrogenase